MFIGLVLGFFFLTTFLIIISKAKQWAEKKKTKRPIRVDPQTSKVRVLERPN